MDEVQLQGLWHRMARLMVYNPETDKYLLQMVRPNKFYKGGQWNVSAGGHVDNGESYEKAVLREAREEMGIAANCSDLKEIEQYQTERQKFRGGHERTYRRHNKTFLLRLGGAALNLAPNPEEIEATMWVTSEELVEMLEREPEKMTEGLRHFVDMELAKVTD